MVDAKYDKSLKGILKRVKKYVRLQTPYWAGEGEGRGEEVR